MKIEKFAPFGFGPEYPLSLCGGQLVGKWGWALAGEWEGTRVIVGFTSGSSSGPAVKYRVWYRFEICEGFYYAGEEFLSSNEVGPHCPRLIDLLRITRRAIVEGVTAAAQRDERGLPSADGRPQAGGE